MAAAKGNQYAAKGGRWSAAISKRIEELQAMDKLADALVNKALEGDMQALKEIGDRLDGKAIQSIDAKVDADLTIQVLRYADVADVAPNDGDNQAT